MTGPMPRRRRSRESYRVHLWYGEGGGPVCDPRVSQARLELILSAKEDEVTCKRCVGWIKSRAAAASRAAEGQSRRPRSLALYRVHFWVAGGAAGWKGPACDQSNQRPRKDLVVTASERDVTCQRCAAWMSRNNW